MQGHFVIVVCLFFATKSALALEEVPETRNEKLISTFQIVRFPNDVCIGSNSRNGTCYTSAECSDKGGTSSGSCADGFGVCCTFLITTCGSSTSENLTYWTQPSTVSAGSCSLTVCPISDEICSIRLDLTTFVITGPSTRLTLELNRRFGQTAGSLTVEYLGSTQATNCQADSFGVTGPSPSSNPPVVCGTLTGQHMYVEADTDRCNTLNFAFAEKATTAVTMTNNLGVTSLATRTWDITATQIECTSLTLPPPGCTQYFWSSPTSATYTLTTANYLTAGTSTHLANQHDRFCVRRERGKCTGCFYANAAANFAISGAEQAGENAGQRHFTAPTGCCGYGTTVGGLFGTVMADAVAYAGMGYAGTADETPFGLGWDCIIIPGAFGPTNNGGTEGDIATTQTATLLAQTLKVSNDFPNPWPPQICGALAGIGIGEPLVEEATMGSTYYDTQTESLAAAFGSAENVSVCTRATPFILEFLSDDIEGIGGESGFTEWEQVTTGRGFELVSSQISCA